MARPNKQTVDYFPHVTMHKRTMFILESMWGNDGYAFWFKLLEHLGSTEGHYADFNDTTDWMFFVSKTRLSEETGTKILDTLASLGAICPILWKEKIVWSQNFVDGLKPVYEKRKTPLPAKPGRKPPNPGRKPGQKGQCGTGNTQSIVENREGKGYCPEASRLAGLLADLILENNPRHRQISNGGREDCVARWAHDIEKLMSIDGQSVEDVELVIRWSQADEFWLKNVLSGATLRKQFDRLLLQARGPDAKKREAAAQQAAAEKRREEEAEAKRERRAESDAMDRWLRGLSNDEYDILFAEAKEEFGDVPKNGARILIEFKMWEIHKAEMTTKEA